MVILSLVLYLIAILLLVVILGGKEGMVLISVSNSQRPASFEAARES